jgi:hypothetical protein
LKTTHIKHSKHEMNIFKKKKKKKEWKQKKQILGHVIKHLKKTFTEKIKKQIENKREKCLIVIKKNQT